MALVTVVVVVVIHDDSVNEPTNAPVSLFFLLFSQRVWEKLSGPFFLSLSAWQTSSKYTQHTQACLVLLEEEEGAVMYEMVEISLKSVGFSGLKPCV